MTWVALVFTLVALAAAIVSMLRVRRLEARVGELELEAERRRKRQNLLIRRVEKLRNLLQDEKARSKDLHSVVVEEKRLLRTGLRDAKDRSKALRALVVEEKKRLSNIRLTVEELRRDRNATRPAGDPRVNALVLREARNATRLERMDRVILLITIPRSASTTLFDLLRSHPMAFVEPTFAIWTALGLTGRRYPTGLSNTNDSTMAIEAEHNIGALIPPSLFDTSAASIAIEKAHPSFYGFDAEGFAARVSAAEKTLGVPISIVYGVREPLEAMWSIADYQRRDPSWYRSLSLTEIPQLIERSLSSMAELASDVPGHIVDYRDVIETGPQLERILSPAVDDSGEWLQRARAAHSRSQRRASQSGQFVGEASSTRDPTGPDGAWEAHGDAIDAAQQRYTELLAAGASQP